MTTCSAHRNKVKPWKRGAARSLRKNQTETEVILWSRLRRRNLGVKFRRQSIILGYIVDFWCPQKRIVIEVDGPGHKNTKEYDRVRDNALARIKIKTIRIKSSRIINNIPSVLDEIREHINARPGR